MDELITSTQPYWLVTQHTSGESEEESRCWGACSQQGALAQKKPSRCWWSS